MMNRKQPYRHDFSGHCAPKARFLASHGTFNSFSVGVFQWIPKTKGGLKKSPVKYRIRGFVGNPEPVYARAREVCRMFDAGECPSTKSELIT